MDEWRGLWKKEDRERRDTDGVIRATQTIGVLVAIIVGLLVVWAASNAYPPGTECHLERDEWVCYDPKTGDIY